MTASEASGTHRRPPLVLVADDDDDSRTMYAEYLADLGYRVLVAAHGEEALLLALDARPDVVVTDVSMPFVDGHEVTRRLRGDRRTQATKVIAVTAFDDAWKSRMLAAGCDAFLTKPCGPDELERAILRLLDAPTGGMRADGSGAA